VRGADHPLVVFALTFLTLWLSARLGRFFLERRPSQREGEQETLNVIVGASLTLLGLIIGFSFSMAVSRYDQRKNYEEAEANAIGTEYVRADLLPPADGARVRALLRDYLDQRVLFYSSRDGQQLRRVEADTARLEAELWSAVRQPANTHHPTPVLALAVSGMNDVLNSRGYTQAAWWNRIPLEAWALMAVIAICCNVLIGYHARHVKRNAMLMLVLPFIVSISFFLIADIDTPRGGVIRVQPQNLMSLSRSLPVH
jgi:hypothetical protein